MLKKILFFCFFSIIFSCNQKIKKPNDLLDRGTFKSLITQIYIYKQTPSIDVRKNIPLEKVSLAILKKHHISPKSFRNSLEYYMLENDELNKILEEIKDSLKNTLPKEEKPQPIKEELIMEENIK